MSTSLSRNTIGEELGLRPIGAFWRDRLWWLLALAGLVVAFALAFTEPAALASSVLHGTSGWLSSVIWQPVLEELAFRGLLQGQLLATGWGKRHLASVSAANAATSVAFTGMHFLHHPPLWAVGVLVPSLALGWLRERHRNVWSPSAMHALFNLEFFGAAALAVH